MTDAEHQRRIPYSEPGPTEKRIRNLHVIIGLILLIVQFFVLSFEDWLFSSGISLPMFIMIIGIVIGRYPSRESGRKFLENIIQPRVGEIPEEHTRLYLRYRRMLITGILLAAYVFTAVFAAIWISLANAGANTLVALPSMALAFALFIPALGYIAGRVLMHIGYHEIRYLLDVEKEIVREHRGEWY